MRSICWVSMLVGLLVGACGSNDSDSPSGDAGNDLSGSGSDDGELWEPACPDGFAPQQGANRMFPSDEDIRRFEVNLPQSIDAPRPVFVALTGTEQMEASFRSQSKLSALPADGWIVLTPYRECSTAGTTCNANGSDGRIWEPWYDGESRPTDNEGKDVRFIESMVKCAATVWPIDQRRIYIGGISAGGSFTNRNMTFNSDFFAGGVNSSGNWYGGGVEPATPRAMSPTIVISIWGGDTDKWPQINPIADYAPETRSAGLFYAAQDDVVHLACTGEHGHMWPPDLTPWLVETLLRHPLGTPAADFVLDPPPPAPHTCVIGAYTDH